MINQGPGLNAKGVLSFSPGLRAGASRGTPPMGLNPERVASVPHSSRKRCDGVAQVSKPACSGHAKPYSSGLADYTGLTGRNDRRHEEMLARRTAPYEINAVKMKLSSRRIQSMKELYAIEETFPGVCGNPVVFAARYGLKLSKSYEAFLRRQKATGNGARRAVPPRKLVAGR